MPSIAKILVTMVVASSAGHSTGKVTYRIVRQNPAPEVKLASSSAGSRLVTDVTVSR